VLILLRRGLLRLHPLYLCRLLLHHRRRLGLVEDVLVFAQELRERLLYHLMVDCFFYFYDLYLQQVTHEGREVLRELVRDGVFPFGCRCETIYVLS